MSPPEDAEYLSPEEHTEVSNFVRQVFERIFILKADRVRLESDGDQIHIAFSSKRQTVSNATVTSSAFDLVWIWMVQHAFVAVQQKGYSTPTFAASLPWQSGQLWFHAQCSKTLNRKRALTFENFRKVPKDQAYLIDEDLGEGDPFGEKEREQWRRFASGDTLAINKAQLERVTEVRIGPPRILIVEQNDTHRQALRKILEKAKYRVQQATDGEDALRVIEEAPPTIVITDLEMPKLDGVELLRRIKGSDKLKLLQVMIFSSKTDPNVEVEMLELGADEYCQKSASMKVFMKRLENLIAKAVAVSKADAMAAEENEDS